MTRRYLYDGTDLAAELDANGNRIRTYAYWPGVDQPYSMRTWEGGQNGAIHYYAPDFPTANVRGLFNTNGAVTHQYEYAPYGEAQSVSGWPGNPLRFAARELDEGAGLYYVRARWYAPVLGRFISEDPIGLEGGINNYAYALNDPVNLSDPTGLAPCDAFWDGVGITLTSPVGGCDAEEPWHKGFFTSGSDFGGLGGRTSAFGGLVVGTGFGGWQDDGSMPVVAEIEGPGVGLLTCGFMALGTYAYHRQLRTLERRVREAWLERLRMDDQVRRFTIPGSSQNGFAEARLAYQRADKAYNELREDYRVAAISEFAAGGATAVCVAAMVAPTP